MDLGELSTGIQSPFIPIVLWVLFAIGLVVSLLVTLITARGGSRRRAVLLIGSGLLILALAVGLLLWHRYDLANVIDSELCPGPPEGLITYEGAYVEISRDDLFPRYRACLRLQYGLAAWTLGGYLLLVATGAIIQRRISRPLAP